MSTRDIRNVVKEKYGQAALQVQTGRSTCCGPGPTLKNCCDSITSNLYSARESGEVPEAAMRASLGCGNPTALAQLNPGEIENIPLADNSVDVIISNCVINLSGDKDRVFREAFRVLKPGGRLAVSDVVVTGEVPAAIRKSVELWTGCVAGALSDSDYTTKLASAGFERIGIEPTRVYDIEDARQFLAGQGVDVNVIAPQVAGKFMSAFMRAYKPDRKGCCAPTCCAA